MKKIIFPILLVIAVFAGYSCVEDNGNYTYNTPPKFYVDTVGKSADLTRRMLQYEQLNIVPDLVFEGDKSKLKHSWMFYPDAFSQYTGKDLVAEPIPGQENSPTLSMEITYSPGTYYIEYMATELSTGRQVSMRWKVNVEGTLGGGWLVYYQKNGVSDCDLIKTKLLIGSLNEERVLRNIYSQANPTRPITSDPVLCGSFLTSSSAIPRNWIMLMWEDGGIRASIDDMSVLKEFDELFYDDVIAKPEGHSGWLYNGSRGFGIEIFINNGNLYANDTSWGGDDPIFFGPMATLDGSSSYLAPYAITTDGLDRVVFDQEGMRFLFNYRYGGALQPISSTAQTLFDFDNIGKKMIYMDYGYGNTSSFMAYGVCKNPVDNGERYIYLMNFNSSASGSFATPGVLNLTGAPEITSSEIFAFGQRGPVLFYAGQKTIYQIDYSLDQGTWPYTPSVNPGWTFGAGETITCMKFMKHVGIDVGERTDDKYLFVATWNESTSEGKVYVLQADVASGVLAPQPAATYTGFGKVKDMCFKHR